MLSDQWLWNAGTPVFVPLYTSLFAQKEQHRKKTIKSNNKQQSRQALTQL